MEGQSGPMFELFRGRLISGFTALYGNLPDILVILELMLKGKHPLTNPNYIDP